MNIATSDNPRRAYFDDLSERWDQIYDIARARPLLCAGLERLQVGPAERVVDLGCGTGVDVALEVDADAAAVGGRARGCPARPLR
mgnify:CR=1 FL=1